MHDQLCWKRGHSRLQIQGQYTEPKEDTGLLGAAVYPAGRTFIHTDSESQGFCITLEYYS